MAQQPVAPEALTLLEQSLADMAVPDTQTVKSAEARIKAALRSPSSIPHLARLLAQSSSPQVRQLSAILLRMRTRKHWAKLTCETQAHFCASLLQALAKETDRMVALNTTYLIAAVSHLQFDAHGDWPELLAFMDKAASTAGFQETCMYLFFALTDTIGTRLGASLPAIVALYKTVMQRAETPAAFLAAVKASNALVEFVSVNADASEGEEVLQCRELIQFIVDSLGVVQDEQVLVDVAQVIGQVSASRLPLINPYVSPALLGLVSVFTDRRRAAACRSAAASAVMEIVRTKSRMCVKKGLVGGLFDSAVVLVAEDYEGFLRLVMKQEVQYGDVDDKGEGDEEGDEEEVLIRSAGSGLLDAMAMYLPSHVMVKRVSQTFSQLVASGAVKDQWTALSVLLHCTEGLAEAFSQPDTFRPLLAMVIEAGTKSRDTIVRVAAWMCISEWIACLSEEVLEEGNFVEAALRQLKDSSLAVVACACDVLDVMFEQCSFKTLQPHMHHVIEPLLTVIHAQCSRSLKATALSALSSLIAASGSHFHPYVVSTVPILINLMKIVHPPDLSLRAYATKAIGHLAVCVSQAPDQPPIPIDDFFPVMEHVLAGLALNDPGLTEASFDCIGNLARALGHRLDSVLEHLLTVIIEPTIGEDGIERCVEDTSNAMVPQALRENLADDANLNDDDTDEPDDEFAPGVRVKYNVRTATVEIKVAGLRALRMLLVYVGGAPMKPFLEDLSRCGQHAAEYIFHSVRQEGILLLKQVLLAELADNPLPPLGPQQIETAAKFCMESHREVDPDKAWLPGLPAACVPPARPMQRLEQIFFPLWFELVELDEEKEVVETSMAAMEQIVATFGPAAVQTNMNRLMELLIKVLQAETACQEFDYKGAEDDEEEDPGNHDPLIDAACALLGVIAQACGKGFQPYLHAVCSALAPRLDPTKSVFDRVSAMGAFAEIFGGFGASPILQRYIEPLLPICLAGLQTDSVNLQRNSAYLLGIMMELGSSMPHGSDVYFKCFDALSPLLRRPHYQGSASLTEEETQAVVDNVCGALGRLLLLCPNEQIFAGLLSTLPLQHDMEENLVVYHAVAEMYLQLKEGDKVVRYLSQIVKVMVKALQADEKPGPGARQYILKIARAIGTDYGKRLEPNVAAAVQQIVASS